MNELKCRLKLKFLQRRIDKEVEWNFGYCPKDSVWFDSLLYERNELLDYAESNYPKVYEKFMEEHF